LEKLNYYEGYNFPDDLYYPQEHSWAMVEVEESVRVGMSDFFQSQAGEIVFIDPPEERDEVALGGDLLKYPVQQMCWKTLFPPFRGDN